VVLGGKERAPGFNPFSPRAIFPNFGGGRKLTGGGEFGRKFGQNPTFLTGGLWAFKPLFFYHIIWFPQHKNFLGRLKFYSLKDF